MLPHVSQGDAGRKPRSRWNQPMHGDHYAAIDIGTSAVRLLIGRVRLQGSSRVEKELLVRIPLQLGKDIFTHRELSPQIIRHLTGTITAFRHLRKVFRPRAIRACATSAMRESCNGGEVVREIEETTGIRLEIIDGQQEAEWIFANRIDRQFFDHNKGADSRKIYVPKFGLTDGLILNLI